MASVFSSENCIVACISAQGTSALHDGGVDIRSLFKELDIRLEETFHFTKEQTVKCRVVNCNVPHWHSPLLMKTNIRRVCQDTILNPKLFRFKELHIEVEVSLVVKFLFCLRYWFKVLQKKMRREPDSYRMGNIFGQPAQEKAFTATTRRIASNVRNAFRQEVRIFGVPLPSPQCFYYPFQLRDSVMGPTQTSLTIFTVQMAMKYRLGSVISQLDQGYKIHNALLVSPVVGTVVSTQNITVLPPSVALRTSTRISYSTRKRTMMRISTMMKRTKTHPAPLNQRNARKRLPTRRWVVSLTGMTFGPR